MCTWWGVGGFCTFACESVCLCVCPDVRACIFMVEGFGIGLMNEQENLKNIRKKTHASDCSAVGLCVCSYILSHGMMPRPHATSGLGCLPGMGSHLYLMKSSLFTQAVLFQRCLKAGMPLAWRPSRYKNLQFVAQI